MVYKINRVMLLVCGMWNVIILGVGDVVLRSISPCTTTTSLFIEYISLYTFWHNFVRKLIL